MNNKAKSIIILTLVIISTSCGYKSKSPALDKVVIKGNIQGTDSTFVYLKHINPFNYNNNSILDSSLVKTNGDFEFEIKKTLPLLINISKNGKQHPVNQVLRRDPHNYYYGYCAMFYTPEPTLLLTNKSIIQLDWKVGERFDSYTFDASIASDQEIFYNYYRQENIGDFLRYEDGNFTIMDPQIAWNSIEQTTNELVIKYGLNNTNLEDIFHNYLYTEIKLGAINEYLNWYEYLFSDELQKAFANNRIPDIYTNPFKLYANSHWNIQSVEYYKMTERFITYNMNKSLNKFRQYYPPSVSKISMARKVLKPKVADKYATNFK